MVKLSTKKGLVCKGYPQVVCVELQDTFAPVPTLDEIIMLLYFSCYKYFGVYEMDVKYMFPYA
jgi:hypothetical protein